MKNTKELFIRLYTETLYSNFIVPLRGSNYIQLLYCGFKERLDFLFGQIRWLVWQEFINGLDQKMVKIWLVFEANQLDQNLTKTWLGFGQKLITTWVVFNINKAIRNLYRTWADFEAKIGMNWIRSKRLMGFIRLEYYQMCSENKAITYHYLILTNSLFICCVSNKNL